MSNVTTILRTEGVQTSSFNSESVADARYDATAMIRSGAADGAEIMEDGAIVERLAAPLPESNGTTVAELAREHGMKPAGLRAFADDLLDGLDDVTPMSADVETTIRFALAQVPAQD